MGERQKTLIGSRLFGAVAVSKRGCHMRAHTVFVCKHRGQTQALKAYKRSW